MHHSLINRCASLLALALLGSASMGQAQAPGIHVADPAVYPQPGATSSGESEFGGWTSNQLRGVLSTLPYGLPSQSHVGLAAWDFFPVGYFDSIAPQYIGTGSTLNVSLSQFSPNSTGSTTTEPLSNGMVGRLHQSDLDFMIGVSAAEVITELTVTLIHSTYIPDIMNGGSEVGTPFTDMVLWLDGVEYNPLSAVTDYGSPYGPSEGGTSVSFFATQFTWELEIGAGTEFGLYFSNPADYFSLDSIALHTLGVQPIPEPGTYALLGLGAAYLGIWRRRRRNR